MTPSFPRPKCCGCKRDIRKDELVDALVSPAIGHVEVGRKVTLRDGLRLYTGWR